MRDPISEWERNQRRLQRQARVRQVISWIGLVIACGFALAVAWVFVVVVFASACDVVMR